MLTAAIIALAVVGSLGLLWTSLRKREDAKVERTLIAVFLGVGIVSSVIILVMAAIKEWA